MHLSLSSIKEKLHKPLTAYASHVKLAPPIRKAELESQLAPPTDARKSAVMILLFHEQEQLKVVFIRRSLYVGIHSGQMAFPGGRFEETDLQVETTAFREIEEEIGVKKDQIELVGRLSDIYVPPSNFLISVFVGYMAQKPTYLADEREVAEVLELNFDDFLKADAITEKSFYVPSANQSFTAPCYQTAQCDIWGASAMVLCELIDMLTNNN
jgi:8-oxo-dGTP pyrophosphatase MutT (NUDIX family)